MKHLYLLLAACSFTLTFEACKKDKKTGDTTARQKVIDDYNNNYLASNVTLTGWTGNSASCLAGTVSADVHAKVLQRVNYFRRQVGLNDDITLDTAWNRKCQEAALMMYSNGSLNHYPPTSWKCYTADGALAASKSNLGLGYNSTTAVTGMMEDAGSGNTAAGHRRWILYSRAKIFGHGSTPGSMALWVIGSGSTPPANMPEFTSWPPKGFVPAPLVFARWSFSIPGADFSAATVLMKDGAGAAVSLTQLTLASGYGDNTLVWEPAGINKSSSSDVTYTVTLNNVKVSSVSKTFTYQVTLVKP